MQHVNGHDYTRPSLIRRDPAGPTPRTAHHLRKASSVSATRALWGAGTLATAVALAIAAIPAVGQVSPDAAAEPRIASASASVSASDSTAGSSQAAAAAAANLAATDAAAAAQALADTLWRQVIERRDLRADGPVTVQIVDTQRLADRADAIAAEETGDETASAVLRHLGIAPSDASHCLQDGGFYDVDARVVLLAPGLDLLDTQRVLARSLVGALQDQHFSVRVRRKLGFENRDARAAWHALLCGDAELVADELRRGADSGAAADRAGGSAPGLTPSPGAAFVAALRARGGWRRVDAAYVQLPHSTEHVLHPDRYMDEFDAPVHVELPDVRGLLEPGLVPVAEARLGERDFGLLFLQHADSTLALEAAAGWGGCAAVLYGEPNRDARTLILGAIWDSETDAVEAYDVLMRCIASRQGDAHGMHQASSADLAVWGAATAGSVHALQLRGRTVIALEGVPAANLARILDKIEREMRLDDPTPDVRTLNKADLPWNRAAVGETQLSLRLDLPDTWAAQPADPSTAAGFADKIVLAARRGAATICVAIDPEAHDLLGASGFAHSVARRLQGQGHAVYIRRDEGSQRASSPAYEHVFVQREGIPGTEHEVIYSIAVVPLARGYGCIVLREPGSADAPSQPTEFDAILAGVRLVQEDANPKLASEPLAPAVTRSN